MINICVDIRMIEHSGIGMYIQNILPYLIDCKDLKIIGLGNKEKLAKYEWFKKIELIETTSPIYSIAEQFELKFNMPKCDVFWSPHYNIPVFYGKKLLVTIHDLCHIAMPEIFKPMLKQLYSNLMLRRIRSRADAILCDSEFTRQELLKFTGLKSKENIHVIHCGISEFWIKKEKTEKIYPYPYLLNVGNLKAHKNLERLIIAFGKIKHKIPHHLIVVGKNQEDQNSINQLKRYINGFEDRVFFIGYLEIELLKQYMLNADAFIFPSLYEGFGLPVLEAMACGCPVVTSNKASLPEVCEDAAFYVDPYKIDSIANGINEIIRNNALRDNLIKKGTKRVSFFSWEKTAKQLIELIQRTTKR